MSMFSNLPPEKLSYRKKGKKWRMEHVDFADKRTYLYDSATRKSLRNKIINYNLINGKLNMKDIEYVLNPDGINYGYIPDQIQHYPIMNSKINLLRGEESKRRFDWRAIVTNPDAISEIENNKKEALYARMQQWVMESHASEEEALQELEKIRDFFTYEWQDLREMRCNYLLRHYIKEYNMPLMFNSGFMDAMICGEEIYQCDIRGGEPVVEKINPKKIQILRNGYSNKVEDADMIILIDYWSPGRIIDAYYDVLTDKDIEYISNIPFMQSTDQMDNIDENQNFIFVDPYDSEYGTGSIIEGQLFKSNTLLDKAYVDELGNIRVVRVYWKSYRKIKKVKSYDPITGEEVFDFFTEDYILNKDAGEEEEIFWINEAWEGTKIGKNVYVNMRPRVVQYNRLSNPSRCHFGIIGSLYNVTDMKSYSLVDMMKPYNYLYDAIHDRLNKNIAANWGKILELDFAYVPDGWDIKKWLYFAKNNHVAVKNSFKEGSRGVASGKLAGMMQQSKGFIDAEIGNSIQNDINLLEIIKAEMSDTIGITKQREGQISNRETVGGVERATLQSSHITEPWFAVHDDVKKRVLECFIETAKAAMKGKSTKFQYMLTDGTNMIMDIDGDEFAEADYDIVVDGSQETQELVQKFDMLAQAGLQNQLLSFSSIMKIYSDSSISDIRRIIENDEKSMQERQAQAQQQEMEMRQAEIDANMELNTQKIQADIDKNIRDNETKLILKEMELYASVGDEEPESDSSKEELYEKVREFNNKLKLERDKFEEEKKQNKVNNSFKKDEISIKRKQANKPKTTNK